MRILLYLLLIFLFSCKIKDKESEKPVPVPVVDSYTPFYNKIEEAKYSLKDGDLLVRSGTDMTSQMIRNFNQKDKTYSHSGVVFYTDGVPLVYHILAGEDNPDAKLVADSLRKFCHPRHNSGFAIYRYDLNPQETTTLKEQVLTWHKQRVRFDSTFNLKSDDEMYCSEMIKKGLAGATKNRINIETRKPSKAEALLAATKLPMTAEKIMKLDVIPVDNLYMNPNCKLVQRFDFNPQTKQ